MTSVLAYSPMSDPFASQGRAQANAAAVAQAALRYPSPPLSPPQSLTSQQYLQYTAASKHSSTPPAAISGSSSGSARGTPTSTITSSQVGGRYTPEASPAPDEFGATVPSSSQSTGGLTRPRVSHSLGPGPSAMPISLPQAIASTSSDTTHAYAYTQPTISSTTLATSTPPNSSSSANARKRQSHNPSNLMNASPPKAEHLTDEYVLHPSVFAYKAAHPRRAMVGFGPYVLLQTLGEGEFGKVKLGVHTEYGVEVAIKLIRRGSLDDDESRAVKVEREIDVLKTLKHPNIVRMFDVIDTDKYIGIVLEFAGGGELFDHILANKYLKEKDAQRLFAQLVSGVDYLHRKQIVHRDLKLENLLLDKHRNIIITDFGFANRFDNAADDLMATSCGSPCYAAPELVVSEGVYMGSAVDVWSCGVILYAMLSGYLPYDDDPSNPDGDNINQLYNYILNTPLCFPDHLSESARHLLRIMMVPDPHHRCTIADIMAHPWLSAHRDLFERTVEMNEWLFQDQMYKKSQAAKKELNERKRVQQEAKYFRAIQRSQSSMPGTAVTASMMDARRTQRHHSALPGSATVQDHLASSGTRTPPLSAISRSLAPTPPLPAVTQASAVLAEATISPSTTITGLGAGVPHAISAALTPNGSVGPISNHAVENEPLNSGITFQPQTVPIVDPDVDTARPNTTPMSQNTNRHTIQVEYDADMTYEQMNADMLAGTPRAEAETTVPGTPLDIGLGPGSVFNDTDMSASELGHYAEATAEGADPDIRATPNTSEILTPLSNTPPTQAVLIASAEHPSAVNPERSLPSTPSKRKSADDQADAPITPRASMAPRHDDDSSTPKADVDTPRASRFMSGKDKQADSAAMPPPSSIPIKPSSVPGPGLDDSGLPKAPPRKRDRGRKGMSLDKFGLSKLLGGSSVDLTRPPSAGLAAASLQKQQERISEEKAQKEGRRMSSRPKPSDADKEDKKSKRKTLQIMGSLGSKTFTPPTPATPLANRDMNPIPTTHTANTGTKSSPIGVEAEGIQPGARNMGQSSTSIVTVDALGAPSRDKPSPAPASSSAAKKVMDWFRRKSLARETFGGASASVSTSGQLRPAVRSDTPDSFVRIEPPSPASIPEESTGGVGKTSVAMSSTSSIAAIDETDENIPAPAPAATSSAQPQIGQITLEEPIKSPVRTPLGEAPSAGNVPKPSPPRVQVSSPTRSKSANVTTTLHLPSAASTTTLLNPPRSMQDPGLLATRSAEDSKLRVHTGVVDQSALSSKPPPEVMLEVVRVLMEMGMDVKRETEYRLRCTRARRRKAGEPAQSKGLVGSVMSMGGSSGGFLSGNASTTRLDSRGLPLPNSPSSTSILSPGGFKGMLRRGSNAASGMLPRTASEPQGLLASPAVSSVAGTPLIGNIEPIYGEHSGDEVKYNVELCRIKNLPGLYLLNIKRLKGNVWSFKFIYQTIIERCETLTH